MFLHSFLVHYSLHTYSSLLTVYLCYSCKHKHDNVKSFLSVEH